MKKFFKDLVDVQKYRMKNNSLQLQLDNAIAANEELKLAKFDELLSYKEKYENSKKELKNAKIRLEKQKEIIRKGGKKW